MEFKITNKNGATLKTANKYVREDIAITIDESLFENSGGSAGGTAVPNTGYVEKVYLNTSMSNEDIVSLLSQLTYTGENNVYVVLLTENVEISLVVRNMNGIYGIGDDLNLYFVSGDIDMGFVGWNPDFNGEVVVNTTVMNANNTYGTQNELIKDLVSITPFGSGSCEPTGLPLEVDSLPIKEGTAVPTSGMVDKVYFNTNLSFENTIKILETLTYVQTPLFMSPLCPILFSQDGSPIIFVGKSSNDDVNSYFITIVTDMANQVFVNAFDYNNGTYEDGWKLSEYTISKQVISEYEGLPIGSQNELIKDLVSTTPFESDGVEDAVYKTPRKFTDVYIYADDFTYGKLSSSYSVIGSEEVETKPTSNIISSTMESFYLYYVKSENDIFVYIDVGYGLMWVNVSMMTELVYGAALPFKGECEKGDEPTDIGYYAYFIPEYLYQVKDSQLQELKYKPKKIEISPGGIEETFKPLKGEYFSEVKLTAGDYIVPYRIHHNYTILGVKGACVPIEDFFRNLTFDKIELENVSLEDKMFYRKRINEIKINVATSYSSTNSCYLGERAFSYCEANKIILKGDYILIFNATIRSGYDINGNFAEVYNKHLGFSGCSKLTTLVLDFPDFAPITSTNYPDFAVDLFRNTPIANGTGYIYVPDNKVDYVKTLAGYAQVSSQIRPLSEYVEE